MCFLLLSLAQAADPLSTLAAPHTGSRQRAAGSWINVPAGGSIDLLNTTESGKIVRIWMTVATDQAARLRSLSVEMYWDGATTPAVLSPIGDFFGLGNGEGGDVASLPVVSVDDGFSCFWPMPFAKGAVVRIHNDSDKAAHIYYQIDWDKLPAKAVEPNRFQASFRREAHTQPGKPFTVAEITGTGHYVGTVLSIDPLSPGWWGEGDDLYRVDGAESWNIRGTGTEDLVLQGFGVVANSNLYAGVVDQPGRHTTLYRWFIEDPLPFKSALTVAMEQQGRPIMERSDDVSATAFWYQLPPLSAVPPLPPMSERLPPPALATERWNLPNPPLPVSLSALADVARQPMGCVPLSDHPLQKPAGIQDIAGVRMEILPSCGDTASAIDLHKGESLTLPLPPGGDSLYVFLAADGEAGKPALLLTSGSWSSEMVFGQQLNPSKDPWPVPNGRIATLLDQNMQLRASYVAQIPLPTGATTITFQAAPGVNATLYAVSRAAP